VTVIQLMMHGLIRLNLILLIKFGIYWDNEHIRSIAKIFSEINYRIKYNILFNKNQIIEHFIITSCRFEEDLA